MKTDETVSSTEQPITTAGGGGLEKSGLEKLWEEILTMSPEPHLLAKVALRMPELRERAWKAYADTRPSFEALWDMLSPQSSWSGMRKLPGLLLIERFGKSGTLLRLAKEVPEVIEEAVECLLSKKPPVGTKILLECLPSTRIRPDLQLRVARSLWAQAEDWEKATVATVILLETSGMTEEISQHFHVRGDLPYALMSALIFRDPDCREELFRGNRKKMSDEVLFLLLQTGPPYGREVAEQLVTQAGKHSFRELLAVLVLFPEFTEPVWKKLEAMPLAKCQLDEVAEAAPVLADRARALIRPPARNALTVFSEMMKLVGRC